MKVLVTSKSFGRTNPGAISRLKESGIDLFWSDVSSPSPADIARQIPGADALIVGNDTVNRQVIDAADRLKLIHMNGTGLDGIDVSYASARGIYVMNAPGANRNAVAEMVIALMLAAGRKIVSHIELLKQGRWERTPGNEISGSKVGLIGYGNVGMRVAQLLKGFSVEISAYDPYAALDGNGMGEITFAEHPDEIFSSSDWVILAAPLNSKTEKIVNERTLGLMKPTAYLINTARGGLIDEQALCRAVDRKQIAGASLDAFAEEPLSADSPLRRTDVVLTPHIAATSIESTSKITEIIADHILSMLVHGNAEAAVNYHEAACLSKDGHTNT